MLTKGNRPVYYLSVCTITCGITHRKQDGSDLTKEDVIQEMTYAIENLFSHFGDNAHEELHLTHTINSEIDQ